jgi:hypothetical protein
VVFPDAGLVFLAWFTFDAAQPAAVTDPNPVGTMTITWDNCEKARLSYDLPDTGLSREIEIFRIVADNAALCDALDDS